MVKGRIRMKRDKFYPATDESSVERTEAPKEADSSNLETPHLPAMDYEKSSTGKYAAEGSENLNINKNSSKAMSIKEET